MALQSTLGWNLGCGLEGSMFSLAVSCHGMAVGVVTRTYMNSEGGLISGDNVAL